MIDLLLMIVSLVFAGQCFRTPRLLTAALWLAGVSALLAVLFFRLGAPQLAVIELSVGAGLVTVLFVFAISVAGDEPITAPSLVPWPVAILLPLGAVALVGWLALPLAPLEAVAAERPLAEILWQERGMDMLGQVVIIFCGVLGMLGLLAEARSPLGQAATAEVVARREWELQELQQKALP
jgi:uncharacterized MnhB-related membrane protein